MSEAPNERNFVKRAFSAEKGSAAALGQGKLNKYSDLAIEMFHSKVLTPKEMLLPSLGQLATTFFGGLNAYRTLYFVNVLKIDMVYVTAILALISIYDVLNNPLMGAVYDKTRTRWGKARPYIIATSIPYFLSVAILYSGALFFGNSSGNDPKKIIFLFVMLFIEETFSTIYTIPRNNMVSLQTPNPTDRINVGLLNEYVGSLGSSVIFAIFPPLMELNNKGYLNIKMSALFSIIACFSALIGCVGNIAMAIGCRERIILQPKPAPISKSVFYILKNKYAMRNFLANFAVSWWSSGGYSWDFVTQQEIFGGSIQSFLIYSPHDTFNFISVSFIPWFKKIFKNNNKRAVITLRLWDILTVAGMALFGCPNVDKRLVVSLVFAFFYGLDGFNNGPANVFEAELTREINDYTEYVTGERPDGTVNILTDLITKVTKPLEAMLTIAIFKWTGYDTSIPILPWSQGSKQVYQKVFFLYTGISIVPNIIRVIPYFFYDIEGEKREKMYIALNEKRALVAKKQEAEAMMQMVEEVAGMIRDGE